MDQLVSVIVPVYNAEQTIEKCVESLALGRVRDLEIILVDDGSTDGSWQCCQALAQRFSQVRCLRNDGNRGVSCARNKGLELASGEYIFFVDSDDWVSEHYVEMLLKAAREHPDALVVCGLHFLNMVDDYRRTYLWEPAGAEYKVTTSDFFELHRKFLLPQLWNKVFRRDVIRRHDLRFDESQSIGEDFQFVLDYLEAAGIQKCIVLNKPLYYYTRNSQNSLMSQFGHRQREAEFARYAKLRELTGASEAYEKAVEGAKGSYVYHCVRYSKEPKSVQLAMIDEITQDGQAQNHYRNLQTVRRKEAIVLGLRAARDKLALTWGDYWRSRNQKTVEKVRTELAALKEPVTIISQNCIGGVFYQDMQLQFASPTVGLFISGKDFVRFVGDLEHYLRQPMRMRWGEEFPVGMLGDVSIHFMHYETCSEALDAWNRRCGRINRERILVLCTDRDGFDDADFQKWTQLPYPKLLFTANAAYADHPDSLYFREYRKQGAVGELIPHRKFYRRNALAARIRKYK